MSSEINVFDLIRFERFTAAVAGDDGDADADDGGAGGGVLLQGSVPVAAVTVSADVGSELPRVRLTMF